MFETKQRAINAIFQKKCWFAHYNKCQTLTRYLRRYILTFKHFHSNIIIQFLFSNSKMAKNALNSFIYILIWTPKARIILIEIWNKTKKQIKTKMYKHFCLFFHLTSYLVLFCNFKWSHFSNRETKHCLIYYLCDNKGWENLLTYLDEENKLPAKWFSLQNPTQHFLKSNCREEEEEVWISRDFVISFHQRWQKIFIQWYHLLYFEIDKMSVENWLKRISTRLVIKVHRNLK